MQESARLHTFAFLLEMLTHNSALEEDGGGADMEMPEGAGKGGGGS